MDPFVDVMIGGNNTRSNHPYNDPFHLPYEHSGHPNVANAPPSTLQKNVRHITSSLNNGQLLALGVLGLLMIPATGAVASYGLTVFSMAGAGVVAEGATLEILGNAAFVQAASRAGAILGAGKLLETEGLFSVTKMTHEMPKFMQRYLKRVGIEGVIKKAKELGLATKRDMLLLWSRIGKDGVKVSQEFANANGAMTVEMTAGGKWLDNLKLFSPGTPFTEQEALYIWEEVSKETVRQASGQVRSILGNLKPSSVYFKELTEAYANPNILGVDPLQILPRMIFK